MKKYLSKIAILLIVLNILAAISGAYNGNYAQSLLNTVVAMFLYLAKKDYELYPEEL